MNQRRRPIGRQSARHGAVTGEVLSLGLGGTPVALADSQSVLQMYTDCYTLMA